MSGVAAVTMVDVEASLQRIARGEGTHEDANLLRSVIQGLVGQVQAMEDEDPYNQVELDERLLAIGKVDR